MNEWFLVAVTALAALIATKVWIQFRVLRPLHRLTNQTIEVSNGNLAAFQQDCGGIAEIAMLRRSMASMAAHVRRAQDESVAHRHALTDGQEAERARIAHELHDDTVQSLIAIAQSIDLTMDWIDTNPEQAAKMLQTARTQAVESVENLRRLIGDLRPPALEELGLVPALRMLGESDADIDVEITTTGIERRLKEPQELALFRAAQEAVRNARRHGQAKHVDVRVEYGLEEMKLLIRDDGTGFESFADDLECLTRTGHFGLIGIQERIHHLNGSMVIASKRGKGTEIDVRLPLENANQPSQTVRDPVCGAVIQPQQAYGRVVYMGQAHYFCCPVCQGAFQRDPQAYLSLQPADA